MNIAEIAALITNLGVATVYSLILLNWVIKKISRILDDISKTLAKIQTEIKEVKTFLYVRGGEHEIFP